MQLEFHGHYYSTICADDLQRDGMGLELSCDSRLVAEIFFSDTASDFKISLFEKNIPLPVVEQFITEARNVLVPVRRS